MTHTLFHVPSRWSASMAALFVLGLASPATASAQSGTDTSLAAALASQAVARPAAKCYTDAAYAGRRKARLSITNKSVSMPAAKDILIRWEVKWRKGGDLIWGVPGKRSYVWTSVYVNIMTDATAIVRDRKTGRELRCVSWHGDIRP